MNKAEIISQTLRAMKLTVPPSTDDQDEEAFIVSVLQDKLPDGDIKTCEDFKHLNVECCDTCHNFHPHYEMTVIDLPGGGKAWVCDTVK
jgi:hypothetical protein